MTNKNQKHQKQPEQQPTQPTTPTPQEELTDEELGQVVGGGIIVYGGPSAKPTQAALDAC